MTQTDYASGKTERQTRIGSATWGKGQGEDSILVNGEDLGVNEDEDNI